LQSKKFCPIPSVWVVSQDVPQHVGVRHSQPSRSGGVPLLQSDETPVSHAYWHVVPVHDALVAFVGVHTSPQALQLLVVFKVVHVLPQVVSVQVHEPPLQVGVGCAQGLPFTSVPPAPQVHGTPATLQPTCPGAHDPEHTPETHVVFEQTIPLTHSPPLQVSMLLLMPHVTWVGAHTPEQTPAPMQVWLPQSMTVVPH
jgi:hypothetical protein